MLDALLDDVVLALNINQICELADEMDNEGYDYADFRIESLGNGLCCVYLA